MTPVRAFVGLGSNLGDREATLRGAVEALGREAGVRVVRVSSFREYDPVDAPPPKFLNGAAEIETTLPPEELLARLHAIEDRFGRSRPFRNAPRTLDLDLLLYGDLRVRTQGLTVPHPGLEDRAFVLEPLAEIAPEAAEAAKRGAAGRPRTEIVRSVADLRARVGAARREGRAVGLVPTMGAFHEGHLSLMRRARAENGLVVVSLYVNPAQFGPKEDLAAYPRDFDRDARLAAAEGVDLLFAPADAEMYPEGFRTWVVVEGLSSVLCGATRPTHFRGVTTVVAKLFSMVQPDAAYFGAKDYQQATIIRRMALDLNLPIRIEVLPIVRERDGLAMSSRNAYLSPEERARAPAIRRALQAAADLVRQGGRDKEAVLGFLRQELGKVEGLRLDYAAAVDPDTLEEKQELAGKTVLAAAAFLGKTRLIDNVLAEGPG